MKKRSKLLNDIVPKLTVNRNLPYGQGFKMPSKEPDPEIARQLCSKSPNTVDCVMFTYEDISFEERTQFQKFRLKQFHLENKIEKDLLSAGYDVDCEDCEEENSLSSRIKMPVFIPSINIKLKKNGKIKVYSIYDGDGDGDEIMTLIVECYGPRNP